LNIIDELCKRTDYINKQICDIKQIKPTSFTSKVIIDAYCQNPHYLDMVVQAKDVLSKPERHRFIKSTSDTCLQFISFNKIDDASPEIIVQCHFRSQNNLMVENDRMFVTYLIIEACGFTEQFQLLDAIRKDTIKIVFIVNELLEF